MRKFKLGDKVRFVKEESGRTRDAAYTIVSIVKKDKKTYYKIREDMSALYLADSFEKYTSED